MKDSVSLFITNVKIYTEHKIFSNGSLFIKDGKIKNIYTAEQIPDLPNTIQIIDGQDLNLIPGFIDGHIHGAAGADVMDGSTESLEKIAATLPEEGTTSFLATTITQKTENIEKALESVANYYNKPGHAELMGIHLEGPFIETSKAGAQPVKYIMKPNKNLFKRWQDISGNKIKTITLAPEHDKDGDFIQYLNESGVNVSAGHTGTNFTGMKAAVSHGVRQVTHLCNAMTGIHHRDIGVVGAAFQMPELRAELIADGIHVAPEMLQHIYDNIGSERIILITDAMRAKYLTPGDYELGGQPVTVTEEQAILKSNGSLAGSILKMNQGAQNMLALKGVSLSNVIEMASINPAKQLGIFDEKGSIAIGKDADVLLVDDKMNLKYTICHGVITFQEE